MDILISHVDRDHDRWSVIRAIAAVLHAGESDEERKVNFQVEMYKNPAGGVSHNGRGKMTVPYRSTGQKFLLAVREKPIVLGSRKITFRAVEGPRARPDPSTVATLARKPFSDPDIEEKHFRISQELDRRLCVELVQFGVFYRPDYSQGERAFSVEWERNYAKQSASHLRLHYDHKLLRIELGSNATEYEGFNININFSSITKMALGSDSSKPYICFLLETPPNIEQFPMNRSFSGDKRADNKDWKRRVDYLDPKHRTVGPYATQLRIVLWEPDDDKVFFQLCEHAGIHNLITWRKFPGQKQILADHKGFFEHKKLYALHRRLEKLPWLVAFQMEALLHNGLLHTDLINQLLPRVEDLVQRHQHRRSYVAELLRLYQESLQTRSEHPLDVFDSVLRSFNYVDPHTTLSKGLFLCNHVTFTPTRMLLEGPVPTQSNRVIRQYEEFQEHFIRVDFKDEDRLQYRWDHEVDGAIFVRNRVGDTLKYGFELAGRHFQFLSHSMSSLRQHGVYFMAPFKDKDGVTIDPEYIRNSLGDFHGTPLLKCPSKYAARIAQAFTATHPSVRVRRSEWEEIPDIGSSPYLFTDGVGTISQALADRIWENITKDGHRISKARPDAFQIRFLGYKGVVAVDRELDKTSGTIRMRLRPSMRKFENKRAEDAEIEIAQAFYAPNACYLNRPLVMLLEDLGVRKEEFLSLQRQEIADAYTIDASLKQFLRFISGHNLGKPFRLPYLLHRLQSLGLDISPNAPDTSIDTPFLRLLRSVAINDVLRDIKHSARIRIPDSYLLVGIADEGPFYEERGYENVFKLEQHQIYACIQRPEDDKPTWIRGQCSISRSPVAHLGDVQRVYAVGEPPEGMFCAFRHLRNVVVLPSVGKRSLASCLGGGDVDGDLYAVIQNADLLPPSPAEPADYASAGTKTLDRDSTVHDICDFIVEYINSDVLGLLSDRLLVIADQSNEGFADPACKKLAGLCSQAVDYPKNGIPINLDDHNMPLTLIRCKPDWHAAEVVSPRDTDYYRSTRALGHLYREVKLRNISDEDKSLSSTTRFAPLTDPISSALKPYVKAFLGVETGPKHQHDETAKIFSRYEKELSYICVTHTLSNTPDVKLLEAEVVAGTILAKCSQKRMRSDRIYRLRLHASTLVNDTQWDLKGGRHRKGMSSFDDLQTCRIGLKGAWRAWEYSQKYSERFGTNSFGLIALGAIFDCLERLGSEPPRGKGRDA
ncbi:RNA dependent RNA polymerase-domain-containing protein [Coprinopsis sp. MPI-PUGE-AT-0042]|nr:RNA dependent RNA polymerase-domain-containing protein [Coprinopsis sp. MPI-PUGE-AT-0042]